ncbi:MAG: hypothetical protein JKY65_27445 [Planctomycetes bacterium]|nr:hypothetical protein [Planctomycetota bacterium]
MSPEKPTAEEPTAEEPTAEASAEPVPEEDVTRGEGAQIAAVVALTLALIGFATGLAQPKLAAPRLRAVPSAVVTEVPQAPTYGQLPEASLGPNAEWRSHLQDLARTPGDLLAPREVPSEAAKLRALEVRAKRRAYSGAPPTIPHQVSARSAASCLSCHETGLRIGDRVASPMPHRLLVNCLQCHGAPPPRALAAAKGGVKPSHFRGQAEPLRGKRASLGAPPVIPHATHMRERCVSCHGPGASSPALQSSHPWRVNCRQCHAASAAGFAK